MLNKNKYKWAADCVMGALVKYKTADFPPEFQELCNVIIDACERLTPKEPSKLSTNGNDEYFGFCPNCKTFLDDCDNSKCCDECGQAIDWGVTRGK